MMLARSGRTRAVLFALCSLPMAVLVYLGLDNRLGPDPGQYVIEYLGHTAISLLLLTLALSSAVSLGWSSAWLRHRRMLGLFCFFYASLHVMSFVAFILAWQWGEIWQEISERPYITMGMLAFVLLMLMAISSNRWSMRRLGRNWKRLHRVVYPALVLVLVHVAWQVRSDSALWLGYALVAILLLAERIRGSGVVSRWMSRRKSRVST